MMNQHRLVLSVVALFFFSTLSAQQFHKRLSPAEKEHILDGPFADVTKTEAMPPTVKQAFATITAEPSFALANPGQKFQLTDDGVNRGLPRRRLIFAGVRGDEWLVQYELGGLAHSFCVLLFKVDTQKQLQFVWGGKGFQSAKNLDQLRKMVAAGQFSDDIQPYW
jgi:hypothetical protein